MSSKRTGVRVSAKAGVSKVLTRRLVNNSYLTMIDFTKLFHLDYQRAEIKSHTKSINENWDWDFARPLLVSLRDGQLNCVDGRQTASAAMLGGRTSGLAFVWDSWSYEREAKAFFVFNDVPKKQNGWKRFHSHLLAGNATNSRILEIIHDGGCTSPYHPHVANTALADVTKCGVVQQVYRAGGDPLLKSFIKVMKGWKKSGFLSETAKTSVYGRGLMEFLQQQKASPALFKALRVVTPDQIRELAKTMPSKGRIEATQVKRALCSLTGFGAKLKVAA